MKQIIKNNLLKFLLILNVFFIGNFFYKNILKNHFNYSKFFINIQFIHQYLYYLQIISLIIVGIIIRNILKNIIFSKKNILNQKNVNRLVSFFIFYSIIYFVLKISIVNFDQIKFLSLIYKILFLILIFYILINLSNIFTNSIIKLIKINNNSLIEGFRPLISRSIQVIIVFLGILIIFENIGYNIASIIASLGIGGAAIAFASKDTVANFFGSLCIIFDKPFNIGDRIQVGDKIDGNVEFIGIRSTRIRTWSKTLLSVPNHILANELINNWSNMSKRRVKQNIGISYDTSVININLIINDIYNLLKKDSAIDQSYNLVSFNDFGESSLDIVVYYFTNTIIWKEHMKIREKINLNIIEIIKKRESSIAFPSRNIFIQSKV